MSENTYYTQLQDKTFKFTTYLKLLQTEGNLAYEYNPFRNYRLSQTMIEYEGTLYTVDEFCEQIGLTDKGTCDTFEEYLTQYSSWDEFEESNDVKLSSTPIVYQSGDLVDFETNELSFSLNNPITITPQWSYDNSVNLIINDGLNPPRLINSRFSVTERNKYQICDRKGDNDSNIYDQGDQFDIDTSLYKKITTIPRISFKGTLYGGNLKVGNYHFYFKYIDEDGNQSDFFAESGLVSLFIGNTPDSIKGGFRDQNSYKQVRFVLSNLDSGYNKIIIYYTRSTSDVSENAIINAYKITQSFEVITRDSTIITISGYESVEEISLDEINTMYQVYGSAETQAVSQNMLFLANVDKPKTEYDELRDCALRFLPVIDDSKTYDINQIGLDYTGSASGTYYDSQFIYNYVGYWDDELYRFGIVFIQSDNTLSDVYNIRGGMLDSSTTANNYTNVNFYDDSGNRIYVNYDEQYYTIVSDSVNSDDSESSTESILYENAKGVVHIDCPDFNKIIGFNFYVNSEVITYLKDTLKIKGFFFVRQKRIPTTLAQAYTIGIDRISHTPVFPILKDDLPTRDDIDTDSITTDYAYITESFLTQDEDERYLAHDFEERLYVLENQQVVTQGAICPEYDINSPYLNSLFTGSELVIRRSDTQCFLSRNNTIQFYPGNNNSFTSFTKGDSYDTVKIVGIEDNTKLVAIGSSMFSARAGEAETGYDFEYIGKENKITKATNLLRGCYGPYVGITGYEYPGHLVDIKIPDYSVGSMNNYFQIRYEDKSGFYSISDRFDLSDTSWWLNTDGDTYYLSSPIYRGDCYICQFTHRINRNFQDPSAPTNDKIVDKYCWKDHYEVNDEVINVSNFDEINLGDLNAIKLGMFITLVVRSTSNLNIRCLDESNVDETGLFGHARGFYPYYAMTTAGTYKIPESLCINKGYDKSVSERINFEIADVPWIKNEFSNRIAYSNIQVQDAFQNGFRTFEGTHYRDYTKTYGSITKLIEFRGNLICVFEHGVALIPVNERAIAGEGSGGNVYINTSNVLPENPKIISDTFGSQWRESVIKTPIGVYGVDTSGKKIWRTNGTDFEILSDFKIQEFLNENISLSERELEPVIGVRNVKTHYNKFKHDVMFTFYDDLYGFNEKLWNICYNENLQQWITFYSWVPSYSENIYNQFFSFDRTTSKWIAKLGISNTNSDFADGVTLSNNVFTSGRSGLIGILGLSNRNLASGDDIIVNISYELVRDNYGNYKNFEITNGGLYYNGSYNDFIYNENSQTQIVFLLNIRANVTYTYLDSTSSVTESYLNNNITTDVGYYESTVAVIPEDNLQYLTTDFWKHGQAGIIDISDKIQPTHWYGKQHPFEFEFVVASDIDKHKIFDNLEIIGNNSEPESFHYEIVGDCYDFAKDKKNMYIRQEATKELYQYNGMDITYDSDYVDLESIHRPVLDENGKEKGYYDKSTILPLYYSRQDTINEIEDYYHLKDNVDTKDFSALSGGEIVRYSNLDEYRIWNHAKAVDMTSKGRMRGNMQYKEDKWYVQINPINVVYKNEPEWNTEDLFERTVLDVNKIPIELGQSPIPNEVLDATNESLSTDDIPENSIDRAIVSWNWSSTQRQEIKPKDKWIKIRIRYTGNKLAIIQAIKTLYSISYA